MWVFMGPVLAIPCHRYYGMWQPSAALRALFAVIAPSTSSQPSSRTRDATADTDTDRGTDTDAVTVSGGVGAATRHHHNHRHQPPSPERNLLRCHCRRNDKRTFIKFLISDFIVD